MLIVLDNQDYSFSIAEPISGKIKVNLSETFNAHSVTLSLRGYHRSSFSTSAQGDQFGKSATTPPQTRLAKTVLSESWTVATFEEGVAQSGRSEYCFSLTLPDKLVSESIMLQFEQNNLSVTYYLVAQLEPRSPNLYANLTDKTSMMRTDYALYLYMPQAVTPTLEESKLGNPAGNITPNANLSKTLTSKVGGIAGLGSSEAKAIISLDKDTFAPGESVAINIDLDNSECKKAVKRFKIKLERTIQCLSGKKGVGKPIYENTEYLFVDKNFAGVPEKQRVKRTIEFKIPDFDKKYGAVENLHPELRHMVKMFSDSVENTLFKIVYTIHVFVKHQSKLEFGVGNSVPFTINVKNPARHLDWVAAKETQWLDNQSLSHWEPEASYPCVYLHLEIPSVGAYVPVSTWDAANMHAVQMANPAYVAQIDQTAVKNAVFEE
jgi:hypothetical protein